jgi:hypothetical protein
MTIQPFGEGTKEYMHNSTPVYWSHPFVVVNSYLRRVISGRELLTFRGNSIA